MSNYYISVKELLSSFWPVEEIDLPDNYVLDHIRIRPANLNYDQQEGLSFITRIIIGWSFEFAIPNLDNIFVVIGGTDTAYELKCSVYPNQWVALGPLPISINFRNQILLPAKKIYDEYGVSRYIRNEELDYVSVLINGSRIGYSSEEGVQILNQSTFSVLVFLINGTNIFMGIEEVSIILTESQFNPVVYTLGFDSEFRGIYARSATLYWLPEIQINGFDIPGLRIDFEDLAIGNEGVSFDLGLSWEVSYDDQGDFIEDDTELLGFIFSEDWQIAIESATGTVRRNTPQSFSVKTFLKVPFFDAIFSAYFGLSYSSIEGDSSYKTHLNVVKESAASIEVNYSGLKFTLNQFSAGGFLSDTGFSIAGQAGFEIDIYGFALSVQSAAFEYSHLNKTERFQFSLINVTLGQLGNVDKAELTVKASQDDQNNFDIEEITILAVFSWSDLKNLIPSDLQDIVNIPEDGLIEAHLKWVDIEQNGATQTKVVISLKTEVSHLDNLWHFIPVTYRPEVRSVNSIFNMTYDSVDRFANESTSTSTDTEIEIELSAQMEIRLPELAGFNLPGFDLIDVQTGDEEGYITAEFRANYQSVTDADDETEGFTAGIVIQNPFSVDINLPGTQPEQPFIHTSLNKAGFQFEASEDNEEDVEIGGRMFFEGDFNFRPLLPLDFPFASNLNGLLHQVGLNEITGKSSINLKFTEDQFDLEIAGEFEDFGIDIDLFKMLSALSTSQESPSGPEIDIDFDIGFRLIGFNFKTGTNQDSTNSDDQFYFSFSLTVECTMTGLPPLKAAMTLSNDEFSFGLEDLTIPLEIPKYPIDINDLARMEGSSGIWQQNKKALYVSELDDQIALLEDQMSPNTNPSQEFELIKDKAHLELKKLMLDIIMAIHDKVGSQGHPVYQGLVTADTWIHSTILGMLHVDTQIKLNFPEIKFRIPFDNPNGVAISGSGKLVGFADDDPFKALEDYVFTLGLSSEYIFAKIESSGDPIPIPSFGTRYDDGSVSISKFMIGYGYTKNSFAIDFAGELVIPPQLREDADTSDLIGMGIRLPRYNKLAFKLDLIPVSIGKATVLIPLPQFDVDLRTPSAPPLVSTSRCDPYWDGLEFIIRDVYHTDLKRLAFSPFFGFAIIPNLKFDGDLQIGNTDHGLTLIIDDLLVLFGMFVGSGGIVPMPFLADPFQPYFQNICANLRVMGFHINFNMQRPFPSASPMALIEVFGLISNPMMEIDPKGSLANTIRFTLSDAYVEVPDFVLQMFPEAANLVNKRYGFTLNLGTLITFVQSIVSVSKPVVESMIDLSQNASSQIENVFGSLPDTFDTWSILSLLPPELRKFRLGGQIAGFKASACLVIISEEDAKEAFKAKAVRGASKAPALKFQDTNEFTSYTVSKNILFKPTEGYDFTNSWKKEGITGGNWIKADDGIKQEGQINGISYFIYQKDNISGNINITLKVNSKIPQWSGIVCCFKDKDNYYLLRTIKDEDGKRKVVLDRKKSGHLSNIIDKTIYGLKEDKILLKLTTYQDQSDQIFVVDYVQDIDLTKNKSNTRQVGVGKDKNPLEPGKIGLYVKNNSNVLFKDMKVSSVLIAHKNFKKIDANSLKGNGFDVNYTPSRLDDNRLVKNNESLSLFKGIEFKKFNETHLSLIPVEKLEHIKAEQASIYMGAYIKVFEGQRFRFLGRLYADGSFALVSETESKPLQLRVLGFAIKVPFSGYGNLIIVGRQKRNGFYGYVEANGYLDWAPLPNIVRIIVEKKEKPASLKLYSSGQFDLQADANIILFNGGAKIDGSVALSNQRAAFAGRLQFTLGALEDGDHSDSILYLDITGDGLIEGTDKYRFRGTGEVYFLGKQFLNVTVGLDERNAFFDLHFKKPRSQGSGLESLFPIIADCELELNGSCKFNMRRTVRPEFCLSGDGHINVLGAEMRGKGEIKSLPSPKSSGKNDFFEASMEGNLFWQGRKWLGGKIAVGSKGLFISGTTNFGLSLTPTNLSENNIEIASLFLHIQLEGEFKLDVNKQIIYFMFNGFWTLGAAMAGTGNPDEEEDGNKQMLPLASKRLDFTTNDIELNTDTNEYCKDLFHIGGFKFLPFKDISIPIPVLVKKENAITLFKSGKTRYKKRFGSGYNYEPAVELYTPLGNIGLEGFPPFPYHIGEDDEEKPWVANSVNEIFSGYDVSFDEEELNIDFTPFSNVSLALALENDLNKKFPIKLKLQSDGGTATISF